MCGCTVDGGSADGIGMTFPAEFSGTLDVGGRSYGVACRFESAERGTLEVSGVTFAYEGGAVTLTVGDLSLPLGDVPQVVDFVVGYVGLDATMLVESTSDGERVTQRYGEYTVTTVGGRTATVERGGVTLRLAG